jgi:hypothetical protein
VHRGNIAVRGCVAANIAVRGCVAANIAVRGCIASTSRFEGASRQRRGSRVHRVNIAVRGCVAANIAVRLRPKKRSARRGCSRWFIEVIGDSCFSGSVAVSLLSARRTSQPPRVGTSPDGCSARRSEFHRETPRLERLRRPSATSLFLSLSITPLP